MMSLPVYHIYVYIYIYIYSPEALRSHTDFKRCYLNSFKTKILAVAAEIIEIAPTPSVAWPCGCSINSVFSNQFGILDNPETWSTPDELVRRRFNIFFPFVSLFLLCSKTSPHVLQLLKGMPQQCFPAKRFVEHVTSPASQFSSVTEFFIFGRTYPLMSDLVHDVLWCLKD